MAYRHELDEPCELLPPVNDAWMARDSHYGEVKSIYCMDDDTLVCPSRLLEGDMKGREFKSVIADLNDSQRRLLRRMMSTKEKVDHLDVFTEQLQQNYCRAKSEGEQCENDIREAAAMLHRQIDKSLGEMIEKSKQLQQQNLDAVSEKRRYCELLRNDMAEGITLAKDLIATEQLQSKPFSVIQSIESGLDELNTANVGNLPQMRRQPAQINCHAVRASIEDMVLQFMPPPHPMDGHPPPHIAFNAPPPLMDPAFALPAGWPRALH